MSAEKKSGPFTTKFETKVSDSLGKRFSAKLKKAKKSAAQHLRDLIQADLKK